MSWYRRVPIVREWVWILGVYRDLFRAACNGQGRLKDRLRPVIEDHGIQGHPRADAYFARRNEMRQHRQAAAENDTQEAPESTRQPSSGKAPVTDWNPILRGEFDKPYWAELMGFVADERRRHTVFPPHEEVFAALHLTPYAQVKALILGQDPYHNVGQAHGLCFSVRHGVEPPPSLVNIFAELESDLGLAPPPSGSLERWARAGVLLLNATLTVRAHRPASHQRRGWETFTDEVIAAVNAKPERVVFILWGASARRKKSLIDSGRHTVIESPHPSPLSASGGFFGSRPFSRANDALIAAGREPVDWRLT